MIGKSYFVLSVLQAVVSKEWNANTPRDVKVLRGLCAHILCHYSYPEHLANELRVGVWHIKENTSPVAFHSEDSSRTSSRFRHRTWLSGNLTAGNCSLVISNVTQEDEGAYYFRIEFKEPDQYNYFPVTQLHVARASENWTVDTPQDVTAQRGLCARIPCRYSYPSNLKNMARDGIWMKDECTARAVAFHSRNPDAESPRFRHRTRLSGHLEDDNCSLVIDDITQEDEGRYYFRIDFKSPNQYSYLPTTQLHITDFTDKPSIVPTEIVAGKPVNISCTFNTTCNGTTPNLTWVTPTDVPPSVSSTVTQRGDTLTYTSVLTLTPELKHHGENLTCRVRYPSVSSERTLTLTVRSGQSSQEGLDVSLAAAAGAVVLFFTSAVICLILQSRRRTDRPAGDAGGSGSDGAVTDPVGMRQSKKKHYTVHHGKSKAQGKAESDAESKRNVHRDQGQNIYQNRQFEDLVYENL